MWHSFIYPFKAAVGNTALSTAAVGTTLVTLLGVQAVFPTAAQAQDQDQAAPTARYAEGEDVGLAEIVAEWRGYYDDVPVYLCVCQDDTCDQTEQWPFREYDQYQLGVALGPTNGKVAEDSGATCFDIADGSRPDNPREFVIAQGRNGETSSAPPDDLTDDRPDEQTVSPPAIRTPPDAIAPPTTPQPAVQPPTQVANGAIPTATAINEGAAIQLDWPSGASNTVDVTGSTWNINVLNALDCDSLSLVDEKMFEAQRVVGSPVVDEVSGNVAVPVLLASCVESDQSAVFILDPNEGGGYSLYRAQLPGVDGENSAFPNEFSSHAFSTILDMRYWDGALLVRQGDASDSTAIVVFRPSQTPAGRYAGCAMVNVVESDLCPEGM